MVQDTECVATFAVCSPWCTTFKAPIHSGGKRTHVFRKGFHSKHWKEGKGKPHEPVLKTTLAIARPDFSISGFDLFLVHEDTPIGVSVGQELPLLNGGSLIFRNREKHGQLAAYQPIRKAKRKAEELKEKLDSVRGHQRHEDLADEVRNEPLQSQYRVKVFVF